MMLMVRCYCSAAPAITIIRLRRSTTPHLTSSHYTSQHLTTLHKLPQYSIIPYNTTNTTIMHVHAARKNTARTQRARSTRNTQAIRRQHAGNTQATRRQHAGNTQHTPHTTYHIHTSQSVFICLSLINTLRPKLYHHEQDSCFMEKLPAMEGLGAFERLVYIGSNE